MAITTLLEEIQALTPEQQLAVQQFGQFLQCNGSPFSHAVEEFVDQHPELLCRLTQ